MACNSLDTEIVIDMANNNSRESNEKPIFDKYIKLQNQLKKMDTRVHNLRDRPFEIDENDDSDDITLSNIVSNTRRKTILKKKLAMAEKD